MGERFEVARLADMERPDGWAPIRRAMDIRAFGINGWTAHEAGAVLITEHDEARTGHEELYLVMTGEAEFTIDGTAVPAPAGTLLLVRAPEARRSATARAAGTTVISVGATAGAAFTPQPWETNTDVFALLDAGRAAEAKEMLLDALERYDDRGELLYNLACAEAHLGNADAALGHLGDAIAARPAVAEHAPEDPDLASLRDDPRFAALLGLSA
jgi:tetratricopeptide (TPR) repeat protein